MVDPEVPRQGVDPQDRDFRKILGKYLKPDRGSFLASRSWPSRVARPHPRRPIRSLCTQIRGEDQLLGNGSAVPLHAIDALDTFPGREGYPTRQLPFHGASRPDLGLPGTSGVPESKVDKRPPTVCDGVSTVRAFVTGLATPS